MNSRNPHWKKKPSSKKNIQTRSYESAYLSMQLFDDQERFLQVNHLLAKSAKGSLSREGVSFLYDWRVFWNLSNLFSQDHGRDLSEFGHGLQSRSSDFWAFMYRLTQRAIREAHL